MLSTENPPSDPPEIPQLKSGESSNLISSDEKASLNDDNSNNNNNQSQLEVDLFKSGLDDTNQTLPKFSIRDYVFSTRGNDIKTHWPFSSKNLQLCLKHGVKDLLPPFETLESVRNPSSVVKYADENTSNPSVNLSGSSHRPLPVSSKNATQKLADNIKSSTSGKGKEYYQATTTSLSCSDVNSVPSPSRSPILEPDSKNLPVLEKPERAFRAKKVNSINITQSPVKKCKLIVKLGNNTLEHKPNEDLSETMASKVCPVCKTFTSSSNTTLNAHIDQCLFGESTIKCTTASKVIKHRIKPRKTRLMVDIYATAVPCTLEDLDRRNGTNWALNLCFPAQNLEDNNINDVNINTVNNNTYSPTNGEDKNEEGAVYFDSDGTKLRILSKLSDVKSIPNGDDNDGGPRKLVKRDRGSKIVTSKKMKKHMVLKYPPYEQRCSPGLDRCPDVIGAREMNSPPKESEKDELVEPLKACDHHVKCNDSGAIRQWVSSKRTGPIKKKNPEHEYHPDKISKDLRIKNHLPSFDDKYIKKTSDSRFPIVAADQSRKRKEIMPFNPDAEYMPCRTNRAGFSLLDSRDYHDDKRNHMVLSERNFNQLKEKNPSVSNGTGNHTVSRSTKKMRSIGSAVNVDSSFISSSLSKYGIFSSGSPKKTFVGKKLSSLSKKLLSVRHASVSESKKYLGTKRLDFKKPAIQWQNRPVENRGGNASQMGKDSGNLFTDGARVSKIRKKRWGFVNSGKECDASSNHSNASLGSNSHGVAQSTDSFVSGCIPAGTSNDVKAVEVRDEFVPEPISEIHGGEPLTAFSESLAYEGHCSSDLVLSGEQETLSADKVDVNQVEENYFVDVDPIPIPGPPGSFLPSPGRMGSEELQGNSSLTTCKIHSPEDEHELIDHMDSSDSPVSGRSLVYNSIAARSDHAFQSESERVIFDNRMGIGADGPKLNESRAKLVVSEAKFATCGDCESPGVSTPNSVLRLMGKNLMVVNREEINPSPRTRPTQSSAGNDFPDLRWSSVDGVLSISNIRNEHRPSFHNLSRGPPVLETSQTCMQSQHFDFPSSVGSSVRTPEISPNLSRVMLSGRTCNEGSGSSLDCHGYGGRYVFNHDPIRSTPRLYAHTPVPRLRTPESYGDRRKEVIVIDGSPENEARLSPKTTYGESMQEGSLGYCDWGHADPFFGYQTRCYPLCCGTQMVQHADTHVPNFNGMNRNPVMWNQTPEGRNSLAGPLPSNTGQPRSLYFSSGFPLPTNFT